MKIIGTCGNCGGPVVVEPYHSVIPQKPHCKSCGATPQNAFGPVLPMKPKPIVSKKDESDLIERLFGSPWIDRVDKRNFFLEA